MQISTAYSATSLSLAGQTLEAPSTSAKQPQPSMQRDQVQMSDEALESSRKLGRHSEGASDTMQRMLGDVLSLVTGRDVEELRETPDGESREVAAASLAHTEASLSTESVSLSLSGTISTKEGKSLGFSLDLQYDQASFAAQSAQMQAGPEGLSLSYAGTAAELTGTSFSFTMSSTGEDGPRRGKGALHLNDELSRIGKEMKPLVKEFMEATGASGGWGKMNRFLRSVT